MPRKEPVYQPAQLMQAYEFAAVRNILPVVLDPDQTYTKSQVWELVNAYLDKEVD